MTTTLTCTAALTVHLAVGGLGLFDCLKKDRHAYRGADCCQTCVSEATRVHNLVVVLQNHVSAKEREKAARSLRSFDWRCHPELVPALAHALLNDCDKKVRKEVVQTLDKLGTCDPTALVALEQSAVADPDHWTRKRSRKVATRIQKGCKATCPVCGPAPIGVAPVVVGSPMPVQYEVETLPPSRAPRIYGEVPYERVAPLYEGRIPTLPPQGTPDPYWPGTPVLPDPNARPELLPPPIDPLDHGPIEVLPPELPVPAPPATSPSPFGASGGAEAPPPRPTVRAGQAVRMFTVGRPR